MGGNRPTLKSWFCIKPFDKERAGWMVPNEEWGLEINVEGFVCLGAGVLFLLCLPSWSEHIFETGPWLEGNTV